MKTALREWRQAWHQGTALSRAHDSRSAPGRFGWLVLGLIPLLLGAARPNLLWISCEDISPHLGCYGHADATTPNLDRLASQAVRYAHASTVTGVCTTCRASLITGMYPSTLGNQFMRCSIDLPEQVPLFPQYLRDAGYYCTNNSKTDYNITGDHKRCWDECSNQAHWRHRPQVDQPFFAVFNFTNTHESKIFGYRRPENLSDSELHDPDRMQLPPYYPDTPRTRHDWAHYFDNITSMDKRAGELLAQLDADGLADDTIVVFWSDHGVGLPRAKRWIYESGTHVPLIIRVPPKWRTADQAEPGKVSPELVSLLDLPPTMLHLAGLPIPDHFQGQPFLGASRAAPREFVVTIRDRMDERYDMIRAIRDARYKYIRNFQPYRPYFQIINYMEQEHTMQELRRLHAAGQLSPAAEQFMADTKPLEELYDLEQDPHEIHNLIAEADTRPELLATLERFRRELRDWAATTRDTGLIPEAELELRGRALGTRLAILQQDGSEALLERLWETNLAACRADSPRSELRQACRDADPAVRYWGLIGLGNHHAVDDASLAAIEAGLADSSGSVRMAAAHAALRTGQIAAALPVIRAAALSDEEFLSLQAMHLIDELDEQASPIWDVVAQVRQRNRGYPARVAEFLLQSAP